MQSRFVFALAGLTVVAASTSAVGCSSGEDAAPPAYATESSTDVDESSQLRALDVGASEPIVDESDPDAAEGADLEENPLTEDEEEAPALQPLAAPLSVVPSGQSTASIKGRTYKCPGTYSGTCVCAGSPLNCQFANDDQPGRDRYLPPGFMAEYAKRNVSFDKVLDAAAWETTGTFQLYDGQGNARGNYKRPCSTFTNPTGAALTKDTSKICVRVNWGQMRDILLPGKTTPERFVYVLSGAAAGVPASGWVPFAAVVEKAALAKMGAHTPRHVRSFASTSYVVKSALDWKQDPKTFVADNLPSWALAGVGAATAHVKPQAGDYLLRNGNVINLIYSTPGVGGASTDTFLVEHEKLAFRRVTSTSSRPTLVRIPVDDAKKKSMVFAYGSIAGRFGWIALDAIKSAAVASAAAAPPPAQLKSVCTGKADGPFCSDTFMGFAFTCKGGQLEADKTLQCPYPQTHCKSVNADGTLSCED
jgi:hypothetical protein